MKHVRVWLGLLALCLCVCVFAAAEGTAVTREDIVALAAQLQETALTVAPLNDPAGEDALSEDGYAFVYEFATLFADRPEMGSDTRINAALIIDDETVTLGGLQVDMRVNDVLAALPCANPTLEGTYTEALLYLEGDVDSGFRYAYALRDGQRIRSISYTAVEPDDQGAFHATGIQYFFQEEMISSVLLTGLDDGSYMDADQAKEIWFAMAALRDQKEYARVKISLNGAELEPFSAADLVFGEVNYAVQQPEDFQGTPEDGVIDNEDGTYFRLVEGEGYSAVFTCDAEGGSATLISYTILSDILEGPRAVRLGDIFHEDFNRFRNGEQDTDGVTEVLYGTDGVAPYGKAWYVDGDGMTLRYVTPLGDGREVELYLHYVQNVLTEIIVHTL